MFKIASLDLQTKIILILVSVIVPTYIAVTLLQNQALQPIVDEDLKQLGISTGEALAAEIVANRLFQAANPEKRIENLMLQRLYYQPNIVRLEVYERDWSSDKAKLIASSIEETQEPVSLLIPLVTAVASEKITGEDGLPYWKLLVPIRLGLGSASNQKSLAKVAGIVLVVVSLKSSLEMAGTYWKISLIGAALSVVGLIFLLNYFLKKTIQNERLLRRAEDKNVALSAELHETQQKMGNLEKFAVMGQLTATLAHEIGTPLNAMSGHLQLMQAEEKKPGMSPRFFERLSIIQGELLRIEKIVKNFLQTTAQPEAQRQLVNVNELIDKVLSTFLAKIESLGVGLEFHPDPRLPLVRVVPMELEQILLNLLKNALDSLESKKEIAISERRSASLSLKLTSYVQVSEGKNWVEISVWDSGLGIKRADLSSVMKPFFTTKKPGYGTGLGLSISQELAGKYGGKIEIKTKEGAWACVKLQIPIPMNG